MNWITKLAPKIKSILGGKKSLEVAENSWLKCKQCTQMLYSEELEKTLYVCNNCDFHLPMPPKQRMKNIFDNAVYEEIEYPTTSVDPLNFTDTKSYKKRLKDAQSKSGSPEAFSIGYGKINGISSTLVCMDWNFLAGSVSPGGAEAFIKACEHSIANNAPLVIFTASGGMRMQESILSLMTLPKLTVGVQMLKDTKLPYVVCLCDNSTGGTMASFASLGDVTLAEPKAYIAFAGKRVIENTVGETLPDGFQTSEFLYNHGFIDQIIHRRDIKDKLSGLLSLLLKRAA
jgi:acetyl-CoA carboxylase carboxyl transferase subunit beta|tara:strand:+ start:66 stop:926 length:861 start_codon:yes stop_codon:yes gene_type:complete